MLKIICTLLLTFSLYAESRILCLSGAILDHFLFVSEEELTQLSLQKGGWAPIDHPTLCHYLNSKEGDMVPGGSCVNLLKGLARMGKECTLITKLGNDDKGEYYEDYLRRMKIDSHVHKGEVR